MLRRSDAVDATDPIKIHLLDVGPDEYGDALLLQLGRRSILIDGSHPGDTQAREGHPSIPDQLGKLLVQEEPYKVDLIIVSHAHQDHIGCLPKLVADERLTADWVLAIDPALGWGRAQGEDRDSAATDERALDLAAALREEVRFKLEPDTLDSFLADARSLEDRYIEMLDTLAQRGTRVVRFGQQSTQALTQQFADVGLRIIGPSQAHLLRCAEIINQLSRDTLERASDIFRRDAALDTASVYRQLVSTDIDALDVSRPGPAINLQSIITRFQYKGHKFLFAGDFQFAKPEVNDDDLATSVRRLRRAISQEAPYSFYKVGHHGSFNSFNEDIYQELGGTPLFGTCAGSGSTHHPSRNVLAVLKDHDDELTWVRTDRNGLVSISFGQGDPRIKKAKGTLNNFQPNDTDVPVEVSPAVRGEKVVGPIAGEPAKQQPPVQTLAKPRFSSEVTSAAEDVEISAKIPHVSTRVTISVDIEPRGSTDGKRARALTARPAVDVPRIAGGRALPELLFVTSREGLIENIGQEETATLLDSFDSQNLSLFDSLPRGVASSASAELVREELRRHPEARGVVILGGYDVVSAQILDSLPRSLRETLPDNEDPDRFIVWNDEVYGDRDGDGLPEVPVSRIPDGKSASLIYKALQAADGSRSRRVGIRNVARPFAKGIFDQLPGDGQLLISKTTVFNQRPSLDLTADQIYFMLHGDYVDATRFWGEGTPGNLEAVNIGNLPQDFRGVVFTGCCWGALTVDTPAGLTVPGRPFGPKTPESSLALSFLARGALAFIGCTGAHYSPTEEPYDYFGGPMHRAFWRNYNGGKPPAQALFDAKVEYIGRMPHGRTGAVQTAIEYKILRQYTCLGLGW